MAAESPTEKKPSFTKRDWVYAGLSHPSGFALARGPSRYLLKPGSKILLVGDEHAAGLGQFLGKLAIDSRMNLRFEWERGQLFERWMNPSAVEKALRYKPDLLLVAMPTKLAEPSEVAPRLLAMKRLTGNLTVRYVLPIGESSSLSLALPVADIDAFHTDDVDIHRSPTGAPSARGYAGWAGAVWSWLR